MIDIYQVININKDTILSISPEEYPELYRLRRSTSVIAHLYALMEYMTTYSSPMWPVTNRRYFLFSEEKLATWHKANGGTGDITTWQSHKIFLLHAGLIKTYVAIGEQYDPILQRIWTTAVSKGYRSETLWTVPFYTPQVLQHAEQIAKEYREKHVNLTHIRKNVIARAFDPRTADSLYRSSKHVISEDERRIEMCLREAIKDAIKEKGYTTVEELYSSGLVKCSMDPFKPDKMQVYGSIIRKLLDQKRLLIDRAGCEYHRIRKKDMALIIPKDHKGFIITEKE